MGREPLEAAGRPWEGEEVGDSIVEGNKGRGIGRGEESGLKAEEVLAICWDNGAEAGGSPEARMAEGLFFFK